MQSNKWKSCALSKFLALANQNRSCGCSSAGQTSAQRVQRMQGSSSGGGGNRAVEAAIMQLVALVIPTDAEDKSTPIIGPPMMWRSVSGLLPACATNSS